LPHGPRKALFELALAGLGRAGGAEAVALLERALQSPDSDVRTWAVVSLGRCQSDARKAPLLRALEDAWPVVVRDAATALLREGLDCSRELGPRYREQLQLQVDIARGEWEAVGQVGAAALPALFRASRSTSAVVAEEASTALRQLLASYVPQLPPERAARLSRRSIARAMPASVRRQARRARRALGAVRVWWRARSPR
jgi:HEAT repeat protein